MNSNQFSHEVFMQRCFDLARMGRTGVSPNPMVGAVLVHQNKIIGEGYHEQFGGDHAEVRAVASVVPEKRHLIPDATLYVSLEPCCFYGKTPACTDLIRAQRIKRVVVSALDPTPEVNGQGVAQLKASGVEVITGVLEGAGKSLIARRGKFVNTQMPWITLKFAQTQSGLFSPLPKSRMMISTPLTQRWVHKMRAEADAIMVGMDTVLVDDPALTTRLYPGKSPLRVVIGDVSRLRADLQILNRDAKTLIYHTGKEITESLEAGHARIVALETFSLKSVFQDLAAQNIGNLIIEGGSRLLQSVLATTYWDEAIIIRGAGFFPEGTPAPVVPGTLTNRARCGEDEVLTFVRKC